MKTLTPKKLQTYVLNYDYDISLEQSKEVLELLDGCGTFSSEDIEMATDFVLNREKSRFVDIFK